MTPLAVELKDAATMVGLHADTLRKAIHKRELPARKSGRKILVKVAALEEWFDTLPEASPEDER
jgi:excisionase family DNA binding protein